MEHSSGNEKVIKHLVGNTDGKKSGNKNNKMDLKEMGSLNVDWI
jgi:hypothetical protein